MRQTDKEYAEALYMLAAENNNIEMYSEDLNLIKDIIKSNPEYIELLSSPAIPMGERLSAISEAFEGRICDNIQSFLMILCENSNIRLLENCIDEFSHLVMAFSKKTTANIYSASLLNDEQKIALCKKLEAMTGKTVFPIFNIDETLIGGVKVEIDGKTYDGTVKHRLSEIKDVICE